MPPKGCYQIVRNVLAAGVASDSLKWTADRSHHIRKVNKTFVTPFDREDIEGELRAFPSGENYPLGVTKGISHFNETVRTQSRYIDDGNGTVM